MELLKSRLFFLLILQPEISTSASLAYTKHSTYTPFYIRKVSP